MRAAVAGWGIASLDEPLPPGVDAAPLRRMDRYARCGYLAGGRALAAAGRARGTEPDPRAGVVFGTAFGCRDSITEHAALLARAGSVEEMRPAVFVQTVFNSVNGELAIAWGLGGGAETIVSGRCAGLEALLVAARRVEEGQADLVLAGAAEGLNDAMRNAWSCERRRFGSGGVELAERGAALVLAASSAAPSAPVVSGGRSFFEPEAALAVRRALEALEALGVSPGDVLCGSPDLEGALGAAGLAALRDEPFAAGGLLAAVAAVERVASGRTRRAGVLVRDPEGPTAVAAFAAAG